MGDGSHRRSGRRLWCWMLDVAAAAAAAAAVVDVMVFGMGGGRRCRGGWLSGVVEGLIYKR